jgi:hypothetical protein
MSERDLERDLELPHNTQLVERVQKDIDETDERGRAEWLRQASAATRDFTVAEAITFIALKEKISARVALRIILEKIIYPEEARYDA